MRDENGRFAVGSKHLVKHGMCKTKIYNIWNGMRFRCQNSNSAAYHRYGAREIYVCKRWEKFENFLEDMGEPSVGMSLERINNDGPYSPENCKWATRREQARNNSRNRILEIDGKRRSMTEWSEISGIKMPTIWARIAKGWEVKDAVFLPLMKQKGN